MSALSSSPTVTLLFATSIFAAPVSFNRDIRPIMSDTCFRCHGPDKGSRLANFRLDIRAEALKPLRDGVIPIVPGDPDKSAIVQRIFASTPARRMPPEYAHKELTETQKATIRQWVTEGAIYEGHWAYEPLRRPPVPEIFGSKFPVRNPIDNFVQSRLRKDGLAGSPEADRRTLIRRVTLDLTGLLPSTLEVLAFEKDSSPRAYEKVVDRLLASPRYAEQRTMHWLDAVRYADTCGFHGDNIFPAWPYRDYVLHSFQSNKPFDEFTREQLAGDLIPNATVEQKVASAYNRLNRTSAEGGLQPDEYLAKYGADRVRTISAVWLGATMGCAECHDHKFDPVLTKDFYAMKAFFADIDETGLLPDRGPKAWGDQLYLPTPGQKQVLASLDSRIADVKRQMNARSHVPVTPQIEQALLARWKSGEIGWRIESPEAASSINGAQLNIYNDKSDSDSKPGNGLVVASGPNPDNETYLITLRPGPGSWTAMGLDVHSDESLPGNRVARGADRFVLTGVEATLEEPNRPARKLAFSLASSDENTQNGMPAMAVLDSDTNTGWGAALGESSDPFLALRFAEKLTTGPDSHLIVRLRQDSADYRRATIGRFRLALSSAEYSWPAQGIAEKNQVKNEKIAQNWFGGLPKEALDLLKGKYAPELSDIKKEDFTAVPTEDDLKRIAEAKAKQQKSLPDYLAWASPELATLNAQLATLEAQRNIVDADVARVVTSLATKPRDTRILARGNWMDTSSPMVEPAIPERFGKLDTGGARATRLDLANWIVSSGNPLAARVFANRTWREFFGTGISKVLDDLGSQGEWPSHPELLDWLASEFMHPEWDAAGTHAWDTRHLIRTIVLSQTYRQASSGNTLSEVKDPENRLLARQSRYRVDAENVHDIALEVSGLLKDRFGGPSVKPYEPDGYLATLNFPKREYSASRGDDLYRRGVYTLWRRTFLHPTLLTFDAPTREECTVNRVISNTPLQALVLLNDPIFVEAARSFASRALESHSATATARIDWIFEQALDRKPNSREHRILMDLYAKNLRRFTADPTGARDFVATGDSPLPPKEDIAQLAATTMVTRAVLNLHETITRN